MHNVQFSNAQQLADVNQFGRKQKFSEAQQLSNNQQYTDFDLWEPGQQSSNVEQFSNTKQTAHQQQLKRSKAGQLANLERLFQQIDKEANHAG